VKSGNACSGDSGKSKMPSQTARTTAFSTHYDRGVKRRLERIVLGWVMAVAAFLLDRRLRRAR
jgi:hypothetical protein